MGNTKWSSVEVFYKQTELIYECKSSAGLVNQSFFSARLIKKALMSPDHQQHDWKMKLIIIMKYLMKLMWLQQNPTFPWSLKEPVLHFWKDCSSRFEIQGATLFWEQTGEEKELKGETRAMSALGMGILKDFSPVKFVTLSLNLMDLLNHGWCFSAGLGCQLQEEVC